jgi:hypothetical protein
LRGAGLLREPAAFCAGALFCALAPFGAAPFCVKSTLSS